VDETGLWVSDAWGTDQNPFGRLLHFDPITGDMLAAIDMDLPGGIASGFGSIWIVTWDGTSADASHTLVRIDPASHAIVSELSFSFGSYVATGTDAVWMSDNSSGKVVRIDPQTNTAVATVQTGMSTGGNIIVTESGVWMTWDGVVRIDTDTNEPDPIIDTRHEFSIGIAALDGSIWVSHVRQNIVVRIDPTP
jgi:hypothetical protein